MLLYLKPRDILESMLFLLSFTALIVIASMLETAPLGMAMWIAGGLSLFLWVCFFLIVARDRRREFLDLVVAQAEEANQEALANLRNQLRNPRPVFDLEDYKDHS